MHADIPSVQLSNFAAYWHIVRVGGKGLMYFVDSNVPRCSSNVWCTGSNFASHSLLLKLTSSLPRHTLTKYVCYISPEQCAVVYHVLYWVRCHSCMLGPTLFMQSSPVSMCIHVLIIVHVFASDGPSYDGSSLALVDKLHQEIL